MNILLLGSTGQLGHELARHLPSLGRVFAFSRTELDITDHQAVADVISNNAPDVIINAAAYTAVDKAESERALAYAVNSDAVANLAQLARQVNAWLIHFSTDYVFDGTQASPYSESDATNPVNVYGASKLAGEKAIAAENCNHLIFRATWVIGKDGKNFAKTILRLAVKRKSLSVINDQQGVPTSPGLIAQVSVDAIKAIKNRNPWPVGVYHLTPRGSSTWHDVAKTLIRFADERGVALTARANNIRAISTAEYPTPARRPLNSQLNTDKLTEHLSFRLPHWQEDFLGVATQIVKESQEV